MKVLFAVNDENISTSIVKKYQKQYKEIISYKNVYYFNAILKELQRNKNYDRVVISEDLEEFTSTSIEQKDKFIFDRLDSISDEATSADGKDIPIILICSERRTKSEDILVKLFGISIYNAIIGDDRTQEEVCNLINKPRTKKEAKMYYRIETDNVSYERENESDVSEVEIQNILKHFKGLGKNEDKYVESFANIITQYNDEQMKVVVATLPADVKAVLDAKSPEYKKLIEKGVIVQKEEKPKNSKKTKNIVKKGTSEKLLNTEEKKIMSKPVVVPSSIDKSLYKKTTPKKKVETFDDDEDFEDDDEEIVDDVQQILDNAPKRRGRPKKNSTVQKIEPESKPKRRGRPKKNTIQEESDTLPGLDVEDEEETNILPGFEDDEEKATSMSLPGVEEDEDDEDETTILPGFEEEEENNSLPGFEDDEEEEDTSRTQPGYDEEEDEDDDDNEEEYEEDDDNETEYEEDENELATTPYEKPTPRKQIRTNNTYNNNYSNRNATNAIIEETGNYDNSFDDGVYDGLLTGDKKVVTFVGTHKNGTSFIINNVAQVLSSMGVNVAILDATEEKNSYYIYTKNDENLRRTAISSISNLANGIVEGIKVNNNLTVYTTIPSQKDEIKNSHPILETLVRNHSLVLIDCDFKTPVEYFDKSQEIYLVQTMDVLTIQPLTEFLRDLKTKNILKESKIRIIINKVLHVRGANSKNIVGGMSNYNDPEMSFMTELFDRNTVKMAGLIPFDEDVYARYLESLIECEIKINGYPKEFRSSLNSLAEAIYPLLPDNNSNKKKKNKKGRDDGYVPNSAFSSGMNNTLDNMRKKY